MTRRLVAIVALVLLLPGCGLRTWVEVDIGEDSSGVVQLQVASDEALRQGLATFSPDTDVVDQITEGLGEQGWQIETAPADGEWEGVIATHTFADFAELEGLLGEALQGGESAVILTESDDGYLFEAELAPAAEGADQSDLLAQAAEVIELDGRLAITFPGEVIETDGALSEDRRTASWTYDEETVFGFEASARAEKPGLGLVGILVVAGAGLGLGLLLGAAVRRVRASRASTHQSRLRSRSG